MNISHFFINRPIFATVLSLLIVIVGSVSYFNLAVEQYPEVAPPTVRVMASYPGANAETIAKTVATPLEQEINGVENMLYIQSQSTADGLMTLDVTFKSGTDIDKAQVLVQNRVAVATPRLPETTRRLGVTTKKVSPDLLLVVNMYSPDGTFDQTYIGNYAILNIKDKLARIDGVGDINLFGAAQYAMRIWLNPDKINSLGLGPNEVISSLRSQNVQVATGNLNTLPSGEQNAFELNIQAKGRLETVKDFENIIIKSNADGSIVKLKDIGRVELGAENYATKGYLSGKEAVALPISARPGSNALKTRDELLQTMKELAKDFPKGLEYRIAYNPTQFVDQSIEEVKKTIFEAVILVVLVMLIFLQSFRAAVIPIVAIPVSLIGTFAVMSAIGFSLNNLTLFGLVLAIGIVVDDAIVVVENMEKHLEKGLSAKEAAKLTMSEVGGALVAMGLVLVAVFLPTAFIDGISGKFFQQFGIVVAVATMISVFVSLTLSPAMAAILLKKKPDAKKLNFLQRQGEKYNKFIENVSERYSKTLGFILRKGVVSSVIYGALMGLTFFQMSKIPSGFIPAQDQGYVITVVQLPPGSSLTRTDNVVKELNKRLMKVDGVVDTVSFTGFNGATFTNASNSGAIFSALDSFENRSKKGLDQATIMSKIREATTGIEGAFITTIAPPPLRGVGNGGGFKMMIQDRNGSGFSKLEESVGKMAGGAFAHPDVAFAFTPFEARTPGLYLDIDRERASRLNIPLRNVFNAVELYIGSAFINDFNYLGRTFRVTAQADAQFRKTENDLSRIRVKNTNGNFIPMSSISSLKETSGPSRVLRYNLFPAASLIGEAVQGKSLGEAIGAMEQIADKNLEDGTSYEWTELALQQKNSGNSAYFALLFAVIFVFLLLAAQYESWSLPMAIILIVPMGLFSASISILAAGLDLNILTQIGFVILIALASKNAILIVEFAKEKEDEGLSTFDAAIEAAKLRMRPILMTAFSFILGVIPLVFATGAGFEMRRALGITVFSGMAGVTFFGLLYTPLFYVLMRKVSMWMGRQINKDNKSISNEQLKEA